jgi:hypothetical protein
MIRRGHVVLYLRPVLYAPRPPEARDVVLVPEQILSISLMSFLRSVRSRAVASRVKRSSILGSENCPS